MSLNREDGWFVIHVMAVMTDIVRWASLLTIFAVIEAICLRELWRALCRLRVSLREVAASWRELAGAMRELRGGTRVAGRGAPIDR